MKVEKCIMQDNPPYWRNHRLPGLHRHECFFGTANRQKSIEDGLVVFLTPNMHNGSNKGVHYNKEFDNMIKDAAERRWIEYYGKSIEEFRSRYGKNYI